MALTYYLHRCFFCQKLWCNHNQCHSPTCLEQCLPSANTNCNWFAVCANCSHSFLNEFERQFRYLKPTKLHLDEAADEA